VHHKRTDRQTRRTEMEKCSQ